MSDIFDDIGDWLLERAIEDRDLAETLTQLGERLVGTGIPVCRIVVGRGLAHPVVGLASLTWIPETHQVTVELTPPSLLSAEEVRKTPFGHIALGGIPFMNCRLSEPGEVNRFGLFKKLASEGVTHYLGFSRRFGTPDDPLPKHQSELRGAVLAFCTRRFSGFTDKEIDGFKRLIPAICVCVRVAIDRALVTELLERYLGRISGARVLTGQSARGDGALIDCILFYSDMRGSVALSQSQSTEDFLHSLNSYFDCVAGAVLDHGGEVLNFIGDGVLAIFPIDSATRPAANMCAAALSAAREAFARAEHLNTTQRNGEAPIEFGIALHAGHVIYGNVGTDKRLDFTATGPAVGLVSRCEALTRPLETPLLATGEFARLSPEQGTPLGSHAIRGFAQEVDLTRYAAQAE